MIDYTKELVSLLPHVYDTSASSNIVKLISLFADELTQTSSDLNTMAVWQDISKAQGTMLDLIGQQYGEFRGSASDEFYRFKILTHVAMLNKSQSVNDLLSMISSVFGSGLNGVDLDSSKPGELHINNLPSSFISSNEEQQLIIQRIQDMSAAGVNISDVNFVTIGAMNLKYALVSESIDFANGVLKIGGK